MLVLWMVPLLMVYKVAHLTLDHVILMMLETIFK